jgi:ATP-binding cassette, subfamily C, bacterial CydC
VTVATRALWPSALALAAVAAAIGAALSAVGLMAAAGYLVSRAASRPPILDLALVFVAVRFFGLARPALRYAERIVAHDVTLRLLQRVRRWFCDALVTLAPPQLLAWRSGDLLARLAGDVDTLQDAFIRLAAPTIVAIVVSAVTAAALVTFDRLLAGLFVLVVVANGIVWPLCVVRATRGAGRARNAERAALGADLVTLFQGLDDAIAFGQEDAQRARLASRQETLDRLDRRFGLIEAWHATMGVAWSGLGAGAVLLVLAQRVHADRLDGVWVAALTLAVLAALEAVDGLPQAWQAREQIADAARRVFEVVDAPPARVECSTPEHRPPSTSAPSVRMDGVSFSYGSHGDVAALEEVAFDVSPGEHVAIVGPSGSGKSTLLGLLCRVMDPTGGRILLDEYDLSSLALDDLRRSLALVPQQVHVFDDSLRENVRLARPDASDEEVRRVLSVVRLGALAEQRGLDARPGEAGARLSAGERQRLGIARVLLTDAPLVLVDEPTAHLDAETEREVLAAIRTWSAGRTLLLASHRLSCVHRFDRLLVLDAGRVVASGPHDTLLATSALYRALWEAEQQAF